MKKTDEGVNSNERYYFLGNTDQNPKNSVNLPKAMTGRALLPDHLQRCR